MTLPRIFRFSPLRLSGPWLSVYVCCGNVGDALNIKAQFEQIHSENRIVYVRLQGDVRRVVEDTR